MTLQELETIIQVARLLVSAGLATADQIKAFLQLFRPDMTEAQLNAVLDAIITDAARRKALAEADVRQAQLDASAGRSGPTPIELATGASSP